MPALFELLYMALSGLAGWGITRVLDKKDPAVNIALATTPPAAKQTDFIGSLKTIGLLTAGMVAVYIMFRLFKIKLFGKTIK